MNKNITNFVNDIKKELGANMVGEEIVDFRSNQIAFATTEIDKGEHVRADYCDMFERMIAKHKLNYGVIMPFAVRGRVLYVVSCGEALAA